MEALVYPDPERKALEERYVTTECNLAGAR
jgi:hypothetical protein